MSMTGAGVMHFLHPKPFARIVPGWIAGSPQLALMLVHISGVFEILGGLGLVAQWLMPGPTGEALTKFSAWGLIALYVAVFPANVHMALNGIGFGRGVTPSWILWSRLPMQAVLIAWAWWYT
jgi:uncharacterized membrane protein